MEIKSLIIDIILFAAIAMPLAFLVIYTLNGEKRIKRRINTLCKANNIALANFDVHGNVILGIDTSNSKLILSNRKQIENEFQIIELSSLKECRVKTVKLTPKTTDWVGLELLGANTKKDIAFYEEQDDDNPATDPQVCMQQAIRWEKLIKPHLKAS
jgi:hypothetical protein